jgi:superfamily II DNA or RNA helicase
MKFRLIPPAEISQIRRQIKTLLSSNPGLTSARIAKELVLSESDVRQVLYGSTDIFRAVGDPPKWRLHTAHSKKQANVRASKESRVTKDSPTQNGKKKISRKSRTENWASMPTRGSLPTPHSLKLLRWQKEALQSWQEAGQKGIVTAVSGAGKTHVGIAAIRWQLGRGKAVVVVPNHILQDQWFELLRSTFKTRTVVRLGNGNSQTLDDGHILVAIAASGRKFNFDIKKNTNCLLVADECHRYATEGNRKVLEGGFTARLGLTTSIERMDGLHESTLLDYFGKVVFSYDYAAALKDKVIAPYRSAFVASDFTPSERSAYDILSAELARIRLQLISRHGVTDESFTQFLRDVNFLGDYGSPSASRLAKAWKSKWERRRKLLSQSAGKMRNLERMRNIFNDADRSIVFTLDIESANDIAKMLRKHGIKCGVHSSEKGVDGRNEILAAFAKGELSVIVSVWTLGEGVDVPEADLAVIFGSTLEERTMSQRIGRVLRIKPDKRFARFVYMYVRDTTEDPENGAHETVLAELLEASDDNFVCTLPGQTTALRAFLKPKRRRKAPQAPAG